MGEDVTCCKCSYFRGSPNTLDKNGWVTLFTCWRCKKSIDSTDEIKEIEANL
jgi:hypothetical protein